MEAAVLAIQQLYPQVFHACHVAHTRARSNEYSLSERDSSILAHVAPSRLLRLTEGGQRAMQSASVLDTGRLRALLSTLTARERGTAVRGLEALARGARAMARKEVDS